MSDYLSNLAASLVSPGVGVQPRLPGRFEPQHLAVTGPFDSMSSDNAELTSSTDADHDESAASAKPAHFPGDLAAPSAHAPMGVDTSGVHPASAISPSPPLGDSRPHGTEAAPPGAEPGTPALSKGVSPDLQPIRKPPAVEKAEKPVGPFKTGALSPTPVSDISAASKGSDRLRPLQEPRPASPLSEELRPARPQPSSAQAVPPEARPAAPESDPFTQGSTPRIAVSGESHAQIEPAATPAETRPAASQSAPSAPAAPILGRVDGRPAVEPRFIEPLADVPSSQARREPAPTIRVTIGRIEIRAAMPQAPPVRAQPVRRQPVLPLEQYLQRRNEGNR